MKTSEISLGDKVTGTANTPVKGFLHSQLKEMLKFS